MSGVGSTASAFAAADTGLLLVGTNTLGAGEFATAAAAASFSGDFLGIGKTMQLRLDITHDADTNVTDTLTQALLSFALVGAGNVLFNEDWTFGLADGDRTLTRNFYLPAGVSGLLDISLSSLSGSFTGDAGDLLSAAFSLNTMPEPDAVLNMLAGLGLLVWIHRRRQTRTAAVA